EFVTGLTKSTHRRLREFFLHENIIRVVSRNGKDRNSAIRQRLDDREQHSGLRERKWSFEFQADPAGAGIDISRHVVGRADDGEFVVGARDGSEFPLRSPVGDWRGWSKTDNCVASRKLAELEHEAKRV